MKTALPFHTASPADLPAGALATFVVAVCGLAALGSGVLSVSGLAVICLGMLSASGFATCGSGVLSTAFRFVIRAVSATCSDRRDRADLPRSTPLWHAISNLSPAVATSTDAAGSADRSVISLARRLRRRHRRTGGRHAARPPDSRGREAGRHGAADPKSGGERLIAHRSGDHSPMPRGGLRPHRGSESSRIRRGHGRRGRIRILAGAGFLASLLLLAFAGPYLTPWTWTDVDLGAFREPPSASHWLGTTQTGRDVYAITLHGMRQSLLTGLLVAVSATGLATVAGAVAGYFGGWTDRGLVCVVDLLLVLPPLLAVATVSPALRGSELPVLAPLLAAFMWMVTARVVRGMTVSLRDREYVLAARYLGVRETAIIFRHIVPNLASLLIVDVTLNVSTAVIGETSLSYLGLGVRPPDVSLGTIIADGAPAATVFPWLFLPPVILLVLILFGVNLVGDGLRDALDPGGHR